MNRIAKILLAVAIVAYPIVVLACLAIFHVPIKIFSLFIIFIALVYLLNATGFPVSGGLKARLRKNARFVFLSGLLLVAALFCLVTGRDLLIKLYPVAMCAIFLFTFGSTLFSPPNICFRFACLADKSLSSSLGASFVERYCRKVTVIWCVFFVLNGACALVTVFSNNDTLWSVYNGGISYLLMGILFAVEFFVRRKVKSKMPESIPISQFCAKSRSMDTVLCYERKWSDKIYFTWGDFLVNCAKIRSFLKAHDETERWILHCEDYWFFLCTFVALLQCKKEVLLTANISPNFIEEIRGSGKSQESSAIRFLTDQIDVEGRKIEGADFIPGIIENAPLPSEQEKLDTPKINADETKIFLYTSGSTGHPKAVAQRMTEFEADNAFVISKWGSEFLSRKLCATVSQHHIYGFLFTISLPFTLATPFRRKRIEFPDEFSLLDDDSYMIIAVPAFLKRTVMERETMENPKLPLSNPWIFTSGGAVSPELSKQTDCIFGFCPLEVYGSTETSGIAYRQQKTDGLVWTPFDNAKIWTDKDDGCLTIISPYIKDPNGFKTGDLVDIREDGKFILNGRADSIVKIEEKRISLTEVENRLLQSGLVQDCCVVAMNDRRQYLAAVIVLNSQGKEKFSGMEKFQINRFFHEYLIQFFENVILPKKWRYLDKIPVDVQGKKHKLEIQALFHSDSEG
ncbi:MAG: AMP-binding protein [Treponema sp.]|nr:AMP-binding protein [Treponema sp.]